MRRDTADSARVPRAHTEATLVAPRVATSAVVIRVAVAVVTSVALAAVVTLVVGDMAAVAATAKFSQAFVKLLSRGESRN
jgi:hypothetical protein